MCAMSAMRNFRKEKNYMQSMCAHIMMGDDTNIRIKTDTWARLRDRKGPGESFDEVLRELLDQVEGCNEAPVDA